MSWWKDPVIRAVIVTLLIGLAVVGLVLGLWTWVWPR
jgi:hypothetical protein